jgi:enoyl-CoA hydratase/carnithine racemase
VSEQTAPAVDEPLVLVEHAENGLSRITLNRPRQRNAMSRAARIALVAALDECREAGSKVVILSGNGPAFCAGMDLKESAVDLDKPEPADLVNRRSDWRNVQDEIRSHPAIFIAVVNGFALGGGTTLINTADLAYIDENAEIGMPELGFGAFPGMAGPSTQLSVLPKHVALMMLTADRIDGRTAERFGIVNKALPADELMAEAERVANRICEHDAIALDYSKRALKEIPTHLSDWSSALAFGEHIAAQIRIKRQGAAE